jgi:hypothetical protein
MLAIIPSLLQRSTPALELPALKDNHMRQEASCYSRNGKRRLNIYVATMIAVLASATVLSYTKADLRILTSHQEVKLDAIVTVAMCGFYANEMVKALRTKGEWKGPIYVITDEPSQEDANLCTPVDVRGHHPTFLTQPEFESYKQGVQEFNPDVWSKWHKTQLFQLLPDPDIQTILFIDADILAQQPLAKSFLPSLAPMMADRTCELSAYPERWYTTIPIIGKADKKEAGKIGGFMSIQKRKETAPFLNEWSNRLVRPPFSNRDQGKLTLSVESLDTKICGLPNRWWHVQNQADLMDRLWFAIIGNGTFLHLASSKNWSKNEGASWKEMAAKKCDLSNLPDKVPTSKPFTDKDTR